MYVEHRNTNFTKNKYILNSCLFLTCDISLSVFVLLIKEFAIYKSTVDNNKVIHIVKSILDDMNVRKSYLEYGRHTYSQLPSSHWLWTWHDVTNRNTSSRKRQQSSKKLVKDYIYNNENKFPKMNHNTYIIFKCLVQSNDNKAIKLPFYWSSR